MIVIPIKADLKDASAAIRQMESLSEKSAKSAERMRDAWIEARNAAREMAAAMADLSGAMRAAMPGRGFVSGGGGGGATSAVKRPPVVTPAKMIQKEGPDAIESRYLDRAKSGDLEAIRYVEAARRARKRIARFRGEGDTLDDIINRTRFGQFMGQTFGLPLGRDIRALINSGRAGELGKVMASINPGAVAGWSASASASGAGAAGAAGGALAFAAAAAGVVAFAAAVTSATSTLQSFSQAAATSGGGPAAAMLYDRLGFNARGVVDSAIGSSYGRLEAQRAGVSLLPRELGGNLDSVTAFESIVRRIRSLDDRGARVAAERMGAPELMRVRSWTDDQVARASQMNKRRFGPGQDAAERMQFELEYLKMQGATLLTTLSPAISAMSAALEAVNQRLSVLSSIVDGLNQAMSGLDWIKRAARGAIDPWGAAFDDIKKGLDRVNEQKRIASATERTAEATERIYREGVSGGGARARGALPGRLVGSDNIKTADNLRDLKLGLP